MKKVEGLWLSGCGERNTRYCYCYLDGTIKAAISLHFSHVTDHISTAHPRGNPCLSWGNKLIIFRQYYLATRIDISCEEMGEQL